MLFKKLKAVAIATTLMFTPVAAEAQTNPACAGFASTPCFRLMTYAGFAGTLGTNTAATSAVTALQGDLYSTLAWCNAAANAVSTSFGGGIFVYTKCVQVN